MPRTAIHFQLWLYRITALTAAVAIAYFLPWLFIAGFVFMVVVNVVVMSAFLHWGHSGRNEAWEAAPWMDEHAKHFTRREG